MSNTEFLPVADLILDPSNARNHSKKNLEAIKGSLARFGQQKPIVVTDGNVVIAGNGTLEAARALGWETIWVTRSQLKGSDVTAFAIADNRTGELAEWNLDVLPGTLEALGQEFDLGEIGFDSDDLAKLISEDSSREEEDLNNSNSDLYTKKIEVPIYEPRGEKPPIDSLVDLSKTDLLIEKIVDNPNLSEEEKFFLKVSAYRHTVFNYEKIADFYAHSSPDTQKLMEDSALVIIDFNKAIENGFVALSDSLAKGYNEIP